MSDDKDFASEEAHKVGPYMMHKLKPGTSSAGIEPTYLPCTPDRWGMRYSDGDPERPGQLMYPVARDYARSMFVILIDKIQWGNAYFGKAGSSPVISLTWPLGNDQLSRLVQVLIPIMRTALNSSLGGFGIPMEAMPSIQAFSPGNSMEQGLFSPNLWQMKVNFSVLEDVFHIKNPETDLAGINSHTRSIRELVDTIFHESRHCQQNFWMYALILQHPDNFEFLKFIVRWPAMNCYTNGAIDRSSSAVVSVAAQTKIPADSTALISLKRMAVGSYLATLASWKRASYIPDYMHDQKTFENEYQNARKLAFDLLQNVGLGGTSIDVDAMVDEPWRCRTDYTERPWENDAFFCGDMATAYWNEALGLLLKTHSADQCSRAYELSYSVDRRVSQRDRE
jgi:hypothetical protein